MSPTLEAIELAKTLNRGARKQANREMNPYRSDFGRVTMTAPEVKLKIVGRNITLAASALYWADQVNPQNLEVGDFVTLVTVEHHFIVVGTARLGGVGSAGVVSGDAGGDLSGDFPDPTVQSVLNGLTPLTLEETVLEGDVTGPVDATAVQLAGDVTGRAGSNVVELGGDVTGRAGSNVVNTFQGGKTPLAASKNLSDVGSVTAALANLGIARGSVLITFTSTSTESQQVYVSHGLMGTPTAVVATAEVPFTYVDTITAQVSGLNATVISLMLNSDNAVPTGTQFNVSWVAIL